MVTEPRTKEQHEHVVARGRVLQVNVSGGGVPKTAVDSAWVSRLGLEGDRHREFTVHGGPHQAVCLFSMEAIERLQSEGHPVEPGSVGENLTTTGIEWSLLPPGARARVGDQLELEIASSTTPCKTQIPNFSDGRFSRISIDLHPSDSRMYARVLREGKVNTGDEITVLPPAVDSRAADELLLKRMDRAEGKSGMAAWRAAAEAGYDVRIVEDGDLMMCAAPSIPGPAYNHASGLARYPNLFKLATDFFDKHSSAGWILGEDDEQWAGASPGLGVGVFCGDPLSAPDAPLPAGVTIRPMTPHDADAIGPIYDAAGSTGVAGVTQSGPNPWIAVYRSLATHPHRTILLAELDGVPVAVASLHTHAGTGWLRGAATTPLAQGRGIQTALLAARIRLAAEKGCDLVGAWAVEGETSARNLERMGLRQIGRRVHYLYVPPGVEAPPPGSDE